MLRMQLLMQEKATKKKFIEVEPECVYPQENYLKQQVPKLKKHYDPPPHIVHRIVRSDETPYQRRSRAAASGH